MSAALLLKGCWATAVGGLIKLRLSESKGKGSTAMILITLLTEYVKFWPLRIEHRVSKTTFLYTTMTIQAFFSIDDNLFLLRKILNFYL